ncbi:hypothetical protein BHM03_00049195 [Ensete ventricosum]|nr:hypothetical protein BHM03_00049195 [Ensete ventricosum]
MKGTPRVLTQKRGDKRSLRRGLGLLDHFEGIDLLDLFEGISLLGFYQITGVSPTKGGRQRDRNDIDSCVAGKQQQGRSGALLEGTTSNATVAEETVMVAIKYKRPRRVAKGSINGGGVGEGCDQRRQQLLRPKGSDRWARKTTIGVVDEQG